MTFSAVFVFLLIFPIEHDLSLVHGAGQLITVRSDLRTNHYH